MSNKLKKSKKAQKQFPKSIYSEVQPNAASEGLELINLFYSWETPETAKDKLWNMFQHSLNSRALVGIEPDQIEEMTSFVEVLRDLIRGSALIVGVK